MFRDEEKISALVNLLKRRGVYLYHACQFVDYQSYLEIGGIPSHHCLEQKRLPYTTMVTDNNDQQNGVWDKVFVNPEDRGTTFAGGSNCLPNPYGPILFKVRPEAFLDAIEVAITLRSAGARDFDRHKESLSSLAEVDRIFVYPVETRNVWLERVRYGDRLREAFPQSLGKFVESTEIHCTFPEGYLPLQYVEEVIVDPYELREKPLMYWVNQARAGKNTPFTICPRKFIRKDRKSLYQELSHVIMATYSFFPTSTQGILKYKTASGALKNWAAEIAAKGLEWQYERFVEYLYEGTLFPLSLEQQTLVNR